MLDRTLEKCERENGFIYHQKVPYDPVDLPLNAATHGLVAPEVILSSHWSISLYLCLSLVNLTLSLSLIGQSHPNSVSYW